MTQPLEAQIEAMENQIREQKQKLAELRRQAPPLPVEDYAFVDSFGNQVKLSTLFGDRSELLMIHNMGMGCTSCTMWADGFNGLVPHLENRASFVVESPDDHFVQRQFASDRGWKFRMVSSRGTAFRKIVGFADDKSSPWPGVSTFVKQADGRIVRHASSSFGPGDNYCVAWDLFDLLPDGYKNWDSTEYFYSRPMKKY